METVFEDVLSLCENCGGHGSLHDGTVCTDCTAALEGEIACLTAELHKMQTLVMSLTELRFMRNGEAYVGIQSIDKQTQKDLLEFHEPNVMLSRKFWFLGALQELAAEAKLPRQETVLRKLIDETSPHGNQLLAKAQTYSDILFDQCFLTEGEKETIVQLMEEIIQAS